MKKMLNIVTSAYNEENSIVELYNRICNVMEKEFSYDWKLIICDNASSDNTWKIIETISFRDNRVIAVRLSRNFYLDGALTCGLDLCEGDAAVIMCSDLQDPPEVISDLLRLYENGFDQVLVKIEKRQSLGKIRAILTSVFYTMLEKSTRGLLQKNVSDFRLLSEKAYIAARSLREQKRFLRGIMSWSGFKTATISIVRPPRKYGESKFRARKLFSVIGESFESIFAYSTFPLHAISILGLVLSFVSLLIIPVLIAYVIFWGVPFPGFGTLLFLITFSMALNLLASGILASYIGLIYEETKKRPLYVIDKIVRGKN